MDAAAVPYPARHRPGNLRSYAFKAFALTFATSFAEVLVLDSDNTPVVNPEVKTRGLAVGSCMALQQQCAAWLGRLNCTCCRLQATVVSRNAFSASLSTGWRSDGGSATLHWVAWELNCLRGLVVCDPNLQMYDTALL